MVRDFIGRMRGAAVLLLMLVLSACVAVGDGARNDRVWDESHSRLSTVTWTSPTAFALSNVRDWDWGVDGRDGRRWQVRRHDVRDARAVWFFVEPLGAAPAFAHTFITFELARGGRREFLTVSVEARREADEAYSPVRGLFGAYELIFVWSTERDNLVDTIMRQGKEQRAYRVNVTPEQARVILRGFLDRTNEVARDPRLYHTLEHNCTSELAAVVNREFDQPIPRGPAFWLTGNAARYLHELGYVGAPGSAFAEVDARADLRPLVARVRRLPDPGFSIAWRQALERM